MVHVQTESLRVVNGLLPPEEQVQVQERVDPWLLPPEEQTRVQKQGRQELGSASLLGQQMSLGKSLKND